MSKKPTTWEQAAEQAMKSLRTMDHDGYPEGAIPKASDDLASLFNWAYYSDELGDWTTDHVVPFLASKQADYGCENILAYGINGVRVRISDKLARIKNLRAKGVDPENESIVDSFLDIVGYCVIIRMLEMGTFELPLEAAKPEPTNVSDLVGRRFVFEDRMGNLLDLEVVKEIL